MTPDRFYRPNDPDDDRPEGMTEEEIDEAEEDRLNSLAEDRFYDEFGY